MCHIDYITNAGCQGKAGKGRRVRKHEDRPREVRDTQPEWMKHRILSSVGRGSDRPDLLESPAPSATVGVDVNGDGRADYVVSDIDRDGDGIPDVLESPAPSATVGVDVNGDGRADVTVSGVDRNGDGIPDIMQVIER